MTGQLSPGRAAAERGPARARVRCQPGDDARGAARARRTEPPSGRRRAPAAGATSRSRPSTTSRSSCARTSTCSPSRDDVTLEELIEARKLLEVPAARLAAERRERGATSIACASRSPGEPLRLNTQEQFAYNKGFHSAIVEAAATRSSTSPHSPSSRRCRRTSRARPSAGASTARSTSTTERSRRRSRRATPTRAGSDGSHLEFLVPSTSAPGGTRSAIRKRA